MDHLDPLGSLDYLGKKEMWVILGHQGTLDHLDQKEM